MLCQGLVCPDFHTLVCPLCRHIGTYGRVTAWGRWVTFPWDTVHAEHTLSGHLRLEQMIGMSLERFVSSGAFA